MKTNIIKTKLPTDICGEHEIVEVNLNISDKLREGEESLAVIIHEKLENMVAYNAWEWCGKPYSHDMLTKIADELGLFLTQLGCKVEAKGQQVESLY